METRNPAPKPEPWRTCPKCLAYQSPDISPLGLCYLCATNLVPEVMPRAHQPEKP